MKKLLIMMTVNLFFIGSSVSYANEIVWKLEKEKRGVQVFTRVKEDSVLKEFKGIITVDVAQQKLVNTLKDVAHYDQWMPDIESVKLLSADEKSHLHYIKSDLPWPVSNRDGIYQFNYKTLTNGDIRADVSAKPTALDKVKRTIRIPYVSGYWLLSANGEKSTTVTYQLHADPGGSIPTWLINSSVVDAPYQILLNLKSYVEKQQ